MFSWLVKLHWVIILRIFYEYLGGIVDFSTERESMADLEIDGDRVSEDDLESDSENVEGDVLAAV